MGYMDVPEQQERPPAEQVTEAVKEELRFWVGILADHTKFIRNKFDPTEERLFRRADQFAREFDELRQRVNALFGPTPPGRVAVVEGQVVQATRRLIRYKIEVTEGIRDCRILTELPADLIDHLRREALYFLGVLNVAHGGPPPTRSQLGLPDANRPVNVAPIGLIPFLRQRAFAIGVDLSLFWLKIHFEHAQVLTLFYRPVQEELIRQTADFQRRLEMLYRQALEVDRRRSGLSGLLARVRPAMMEWREFLERLFADIRNCRVPTGQVNFPARLADHMRRETDYYLAILNALGEIRD